jgi:hypothetical protein
MTNTADREAFENWHSNKFEQHLPSIRTGAGYYSGIVQIRWTAWQSRQPEIDALKAVLEQARDALESTGKVKHFGDEGKALAVYPNAQILEALASINAIIDGEK